MVSIAFISAPESNCRYFFVNDFNELQADLTKFLYLVALSFEKLVLVEHIYSTLKSTQCYFKGKIGNFGERGGDRTHDQLIKSQLLYR